MKEIFKQVIITKLRHYWWLVILVMIGLGGLLFLYSFKSPNVFTAK